MSVYYFLAVPCFLWAGVCWLGLKEANTLFHEMDGTRARLQLWMWLGFYAGVGLVLFGAGAIVR